MHGGGVHVYEKFAICFDRQVAHYVRWLRIIQQRLFFFLCKCTYPGSHWESESVD